MDACVAWSLFNVFLIFLLCVSLKPVVAPADAGVDLRLPRAVARLPVDRSSLVVTIDAQGRIYWRGQIVSAQAFEQELRRSVLATSHVLIKADRRARLEVLATVWDDCRRAGVARVTLATNG
jgi:biopolymer transport protein ExbD